MTPAEIFGKVFMLMITSWTRVKSIALKLADEVYGGLLLGAEFYWSTKGDDWSGNSDERRHVGRRLPRPG